MDTKRLRKILKKIATTLGLILFCIGYVLCGAAIFEFIEGKNEENVKDFAALTLLHAEAKAKNFSHEFWDNRTEKIAAGERVISQKDHDKQMKGVVDELIKDYIISIKDEGWDGEETTSHGATNAWRFANCALFATTVVTTIGYGHITPKTQAGRLVTMFYAIIGIPITVLTLARMGHLFGRAFRYGYYYTGKGIKYLVGGITGKNKKKKPALSEDENKLPNTEDENNVNNPEVENNMNNQNEQHDGGGSLTEQKKEDYKDAEQKKEDYKDAETRREELKEKVKAQRIPISLCLLIIFCYILFGGMAFQSAQNSSNVEEEERLKQSGAPDPSQERRDWSLTEACYFCFITISTIGFGDYVYGDEPVQMTGEESFLDQLRLNRKLMFTCMYIFFGMVLNSMCIDLMAREVIRQAYLVAHKCRCVKKKRKKKQMAA